MLQYSTDLKSIKRFWPLIVIPALEFCFHLTLVQIEELMNRNSKHILQTLAKLPTQFRRLIFHYPPLKLEQVDYDDYWKDKRRDKMGSITSFQRQRADWVLARIEPGSSVLDIGSGDGGVLLYITQHISIKPLAADISKHALNYLSSQGVQTIQLDPAALNDFSQFPEVDYVLLFEVLEHMPNPEQYLKQIEKKARRSIFFSIPNTGYFPYRIRMLFGSFVMQWRLHPGEHLRYWTYRDLKWWLSELGYTERSHVHIYEGVPFLNRIWGGLFGMGFVGEIRCA